jgi:hypothetical protein
MRTTSARAARWLVLAAVLSCGGCAERNLFDPTAAGIPVVDAILVVGRPLPDVFLRTTLAPDAPYSEEAAALRGATVSILRGHLRFSYIESNTQPGRYVPSGGETVRDETEYTLEVLLADGTFVTARTTTPADFSVTDWLQLDESTLETRTKLRTFEELGDGVYDAPENQIVYLDGLLEARFPEPSGAGRYQVGILSLDPDSPFVIDADFLDEEDYADFERAVSSPALEASDGFVRLPWFAIFYAGRHKITVHSVDLNWFDLVRSAPEISGGGGPVVGGNAGDGFERPIFHVEGGVGLFGSASLDSIGFVILPRE